MNSGWTPIRLSQRVRVDLPALMSRMEELGVPLAYTREIEEIYFTLLPRRAGDFSRNKIRISCDRLERENVDRVLVHELGHHVDDLEAIAARDEIVRERRRRGGRMGDPYARKDVDEYVAVGFESYYGAARRRFKKENPVLHRAIAAAHEKYRVR